MLMKKIIILCLGFLSVTFIKASHNRGAEILYKRIAPFTNVVGSVTVQVYTYSITVIRYTDDGPAVADRCGDTIYFGDGAKERIARINGAGSCGCGSINNVPVGCGEIIVNTSGYIVKYNVYSVIHTYPGPGTYIISSADPNRNQGVHNIPNSFNIPFFIDAMLVIKSTVLENSSPVLSNPPTDQGVVGSCLSINCAAYDVDGDSLSYELTECKGANGSAITGYFFPETGTNGTFSLNAVTGLLTWCAPQFVDQYNIAIKVNEWRKNACGPYQLIGYVIRDFQVIIRSGVPASYVATTISDTCVKAGTAIHKTMQMSASNASLSLFGETKTFTSNSASISSLNVSGTQTVGFSWQTDCSQIRTMPYDIYIIASPVNSYIQKEYKQFRVTVLPPSPAMLTPVIDSGFVTLSWTSLSSCLNSLTGYNIYRKTGPNNWVANSCGQGVSAGSGFVLIGTAAASATSFTDNDLSLILNGTTAHYVVTARTNNCTEGIAENVQTVTLIVGMKENKLGDEFKLYPNPFKESIEIDLGSKHYQHIKTSVFALDGKRVFESYEGNSGNKINLNLRTLDAGIYLVHITTENGTVYKKIVKE